MWALLALRAGWLAPRPMLPDHMAEDHDARSDNELRTPIGPQREARSARH